MKLERNLELEEILGQIITVKFFLEDWRKKPREKIVTNIVFMGMGEPLLNYNNVINSINILCDTEGLVYFKKKSYFIYIWYCKQNKRLSKRH